MFRELSFLLFPSFPPFFSTLAKLLLRHGFTSLGVSARLLSFRTK